MLWKEQQPSKLVWDHKKRTTGVKPVGNSIIALARQEQELPLRKAALALILPLPQAPDEPLDWVIPNR